MKKVIADGTSDGYGSVGVEVDEQAESAMIAQKMIVHRIRLGSAA